MNYYNILGISKSATQNDIKKAYKKLALKYHPDKPTGNERKFKEISEAYDTLSSPEKKRIYDFGQGDSSSFATQFSQINPHDIFNNFFNNNRDIFNDFFNNNTDIFKEFYNFDMTDQRSNYVSISTTTIRYPDGRIETKTTRSTNNPTSNFRINI